MSGEEENFFINATHALPGSNAVYEVKLGSPISLSSMEMTLNSANLQNSNYNISAQLGNNTFSYWWPSPSTTVNLTIPDGGYSIEDINTFLQNDMNSRNWFLLDSTTNKPFYLLNIAMNLPAYRYVITSYPLTTTATHTNPNALTINNFAPQFIINNAAFAKTIGFNNNQTFPAVQNSSLITIWESDFAPTISSTSVYIISCNWILGSSYQNLQALAMCPITSPFGSAFSYSANSERSWFNCVGSTFNSLKLTLLDENGNILQAQDKQNAFFISVRKKKST